MAFFQFGRKVDVLKEYSLDEIPVFSQLSPSEQNTVDKFLRLVEYKRGDLVYRENSSSDAFYVVVSGRFRLFRDARANFPEETLHYFYRGDHFGETSLLTDKPHSASVEAKSDGMILRLEKSDFLKLVKTMPSISLHLSRSLGHRLTQSEETRGYREVKTLALYSIPQGDDSIRLCMDFAKTLYYETKRKVVLVDFQSAPLSALSGIFQTPHPILFDFKTMDPSVEADLDRTQMIHPSGFHYVGVRAADGQEIEERKIRLLMTFLTYRFNYVLFRLPADLNHPAQKTLSKSDMVYLMTTARPSDLSGSRTAIDEFKKKYGMSSSEIRLIIREEAAQPGFSQEKIEETAGYKVFAMLPSYQEYPEKYESVLRYLSKELSGKLLGLAMGSGAAHGLAHIGVFQALEKEGIRPDIIVGSSMGALIGGLWACGYDAGEIAKIAAHLDKEHGIMKLLLRFVDPVFPVRGLIHGKKLKKFLAHYFGKKTFHDLRVPFKAVATDLFTSEEIVIDTGSVLEAVWASIAIPGIFPPVIREGRQLTDGGVIDPLPVRVLTKMGVKKIIAVNVLLGSKQRQEEYLLHQENLIRYYQRISHKTLPVRSWKKMSQRMTDRYTGNIFNAIMNTIQFLEYEMAAASGTQADILIHPVLSHAHWVEFYSPRKFIQVGVEKTREQMNEIQRLIAE